MDDLFGDLVTVPYIIIVKPDGIRAFITGEYVPSRAAVVQ
jgi:hypothetical protein